MQEVTVQKFRDYAGLITALGILAAVGGQWWDMRNRVANLETAVRAQLSVLAVEQRFMQLEYAAKDSDKRLTALEER